MTSQKNGRAAESRQVEVSDMSRKMKIYAKELNCPIILLSQMSRGIEQRPDHTPQLSDLRESGSIEQDADIVMFLNKPYTYNKALPPNEVILDVKKNRNGTIGEIKLDWDGDTTSFKECVDENANTTEYVYEQPKKREDDEEGGVDMKAISDVAEDLHEVAAADSDMPFDMPFGSDEARQAPPPSDDDVPDEDDEYVDDGDEIDEDGDMPF